MEKILAAFRLADIQTYLNIRAQLEKYSKTDEDVVKYIATKKKNAGVMRQYEAALCPSCHKPMVLGPINTAPYNQLEDKSIKSQWYCFHCDTSIFNKATTLEEINGTISIGRMTKKR